MVSSKQMGLSLQQLVPFCLFAKTMESLSRFNVMVLSGIVGVFMKMERRYLEHEAEQRHQTARKVSN